MIVTEVINETIIYLYSQIIFIELKMIFLSSQVPEVRL